LDKRQKSKYHKTHNFALLYHLQWINWWKRNVYRIFSGDNRGKETTCKT
jgi:hypothetical protein